MTTNWHGAANFPQQLLDFLTKVEGKHYEARDVGDGKVTIGSGFNISEPSVRDKVFITLGITDRRDVSKLATAAARTAEAAYIKELDDAINSHNIATLDGIMAQRAVDTQLDGVGNVPNRRADFRFHSDAEIIDTLNALLPDYDRRLWDWLPALQSYASFQNSLEHIALLSLSFNTKSGSTSLLGPGLRNAIEMGNRAEAWFEIRYGSNSANQPDNIRDGIAKRRYYEAEIFGLYDNPNNVSVAEAKQVLQMYTRHRDAIADYEARFGVGLDGQVGAVNNIDRANNDYGLSVFDGVDTLAQALKPARDLFVYNYVTAKGYTTDINGEVLVGDYWFDLRDRLNARDLVSQAYQPGHDLLVGGAGQRRPQGRQRR